MAAVNPARKLHPPPVDGEVLSTSHPQRLIALAHNAEDLTRGSAFLRGLSMAGHVIILVWLNGDPGKELEFLGARRRIQPGLQRSPAALRQLVHTPREHWRGDKKELAAAIRLDPEVQGLLTKSDAVAAFGREARQVVQQVAEEANTRAVPHSDLTGWAGLSLTWTRLAAPGAAEQFTPADARTLAVNAQIINQSAPAEAQPHLTDLLTRLARSGHHQEASPLLPFLSLSDEDPVEAARRRAVKAYVHTSASGREDPDLRESAAALLGAVDTVWAQGDLARCADLTTLALGLLFHNELHADVMSSPLVQEPESFLRAWNESAVGQALRAPTPARALREVNVTQQTQARQPTQTGGSQRRVVVAQGSYPQFSQEVVAALRARPHVDLRVIDWGSRGEVKGLGVRRELLQERLRQITGEPPQDEALQAQLDAADAMFIDWADRGALAALLHVPQGVHVTLRIHSMDALSSWIHVIDWTLVQDLVLVSDHLRDLVERLLGDRLSQTRVHVVPNTLDRSRLPTGPKTEGHLRRLLMIGWAQRVKDPLWALDVLAQLRAHDPAWRLTLLGPDFTPGRVQSAIDYATEFRHRLAARDVAGGVDFVDATREVTPHLAAAGFVLSTSRRESFGLGLVEGAAAGAVPVVRNWPIFADLDGARRLFSPDWVVESVPEAVERILKHAEPDTWGSASRAAISEVAARFLDRDPAQEMSTIILSGADAALTKETKTNETGTDPARTDPARTDEALS